MDITDQDIEHILADENIQDFLSCLNDFDSLSHKVIINLLLFMFFSNYTDTNENENENDWIEDLLLIFKDNIFTEKYYAPCIIKSHAEITLQYLKKTIRKLKNKRCIRYNKYTITYNMFNEYITSLYVWCKESFECQ